MSENKQELLPCPFCGGAADLVAVGRDWWRIKAHHDEYCMLHETDDVPQTEEQRGYLIRDWNRRAVLSASAGEKSLDERNRKVGEAMMRAASVLPELWEMEIEIEQGYGGVKLVRPDGCKIDFEHDGGQFSDVINHATDYALITASKSNQEQSTNKDGE